MKGIKFFLSAALAAVPTLLTGCSAAEDPVEPGGKQETAAGLEAVASIAGRTRVSNNTFEANDDIMISCVGYADASKTGFDSSPMKAFIGYKYTTADGINFKADVAKGPIPFRDNNSYKFCAIYPAFDALESDGTTPKAYVLSTGTCQGENKNTDPGLKSSIDVMAAEATASNASPTADFTFSHKMALLQIDFMLDNEEGFEDDESEILEKAECKLKNLVLSGTVSYDGKITLSSVVTSDWDPTTAHANKIIGSDKRSMTYNLILLPQTVDNFSVDFKDIKNGVTYKLSNAINLSLESGKITTLNVKVKKSSLEIVSYSITPWTEETTDEVKVSVV